MINFLLITHVNDLYQLLNSPWILGLGILLVFMSITSMNVFQITSICQLSKQAHGWSSIIAIKEPIKCTSPMSFLLFCLYDCFYLFGHVISLIFILHCLVVFFVLSCLLSFVGIFRVGDSMVASSFMGIVYHLSSL